MFIHLLTLQSRSAHYNLSAESEESEMLFEASNKLVFEKLSSFLQLISISGVPDDKLSCSTHANKTIQCKIKRWAHQSFLARLCGGHSQILSPGIECVNLDAPVGLRLPQPHTQHLLDVYTLPGADPGFHVDLKGADSYVPVPVCDRHQAGDLQEHGGRFVRRAQMHPQLRPDDAIGLKLWSQREKATLGLPIHSDDGLGWRQRETGKLVCILSMCDRNKHALTSAVG